MNEHRARLMLPEQILGQALLYLVAAVGRQVVFRDPTRFAAALYDEAWALLASPHGQNLLIEGVRDGRKHNGAIWLASQHPNDFAIERARGPARAPGSCSARPAGRSPRRCGSSAWPDSDDAGATLEQGLETGQCLYRDVRDRVGLIQVLPPALPEVEAALETRPGTQAAPSPGDEMLDDDIDDDDIDDDNRRRDDENEDEDENLDEGDDELATHQPPRCNATSGEWARHRPGGRSTTPTSRPHRPPRPARPGRSDRSA